jgi:penicillin-insensitive murein endopeptidase
VEEWTTWIREELDAGATKVLTEGREGGTSGFFSSERLRRSISYGMRSSSATKTIRDERLYVPPEGDDRPPWWIRAVLIATCGVAAAQDLGTMNPKPLPPLEKPDDPKTPAKDLFGRKTAPVKMEARSIGYYTHGCLAGGVALPINGPTWQVMRLSRNRNWGHPQLIKTLEHLAKKAPSIGWPGFLVGDMAQPRGGPMLTGHASHQIGLDADIWLTPMPDRILTPQERENMSAVSMLKDPFTVDPDKWTPLNTKLIKRAASYPEVDRIFVHPAIKKVLCEQAGSDRAWLTKVRPWWNHYYHFHVRLTCPPGAEGCEGQKPLTGDDGCGQELANWYVMLKKAAIATPSPPETKPWPGKPHLKLSDLPRECGTVLTSGGFEPPPTADALPPAALQAIASKESGPPPPKLDPAELHALIGVTASLAVPLPDRNPDR